MSNEMLKKIFSLALGAVLLFLGGGLRAAPGEDGVWRQARGAVGERDGGRGPKVQATARRQGQENVQLLTYRFDRPELVTDADGVSDVLLAGTETSDNPGEPLLPVLGVRVAVPQGEAVVSVKILPGKAQLLAKDITIRHGENVYPLSQPERAAIRTARNAAIYGAAKRFPAASGTRNGLQRKRGVAFEALLLHPVAYEPKPGRVLWYEEIVVEVTTAPAAQQTGSAKRARLRSARDAAASEALVDNPEVLATYVAEPLGDASGGETAATPALAPLDWGDPIDDTGWTVPALPCIAVENGGTGYVHVVITTDALQPAFESLSSRRRGQGVRSVVVTLDRIVAAYPGADTQTSIRNFIRNAYNVWGIEYVLLGGDSNVIPPRMLYVEANGGIDTDNLPSDLYYQCLDGSFNGNGNNLWGEATDGDGGGDVDLYAEVAIGRVSAETLQEAANWLSKVITYETDCNSGTADYVRSALFVGEHLGFGGVSEYATGCMEQIRNGSSADGYTTRGFAPFDVYTVADTLYDSPSYTWSKTEMIATLNANRYAVINHLGHSNTDYNMKLTNGDVDGLSNQKPSFIYSQGCIAGAFDRDCIAEHFTTSSTAGAFGGVWNARYGWGSYNSTDGPSQRFNRRFWDVFFADGIPYIGIANQLSHERNAPIINRNAIRWCYYETNLFGDPIQMLDGFDAVLELDREAYRSDASAVVSLLIPTQYALGDQTVRLTLDAGGAGGIEVPCPLVGTENRRARYRSAPVSLALLGAVHGQTLHAFWTPKGLHDQAAIDDVPPVILNPLISNPDEDVLRVTWQTDEPARGGIRVGSTVPPGEYLASHASYVTAHEEAVTGLAPFRLYAVAVWAEDLAGNRAELPANPLSTDMNDYLISATVGRQTAAYFDLERDAADWSVQNLTTNACWEYGTPTYGPAIASRCWGTRLDGRYPDGAHAILISPSVRVGLSPIISFRHWYDIEPTPLRYRTILNADCGYIEVYANGAWNDVGALARPALSNDVVTGVGDGWQDVRIPLPAQFANQTIKVRFRFVSDSVRMGRGNPAGWYIDALRFSDFPPQGLSLASVDINDAAPGGNANGAAEPGETFALRLKTFNYTGADIAIREGSFVLLTGGAASGLVTLAGGSPGILDYGTLAAGSMTTSTPFTVSVSSLTPPGTVVTVLQTLIDTAGTVYEHRTAFTIRRTGPISGWVLDVVSAAGLPGVTVSATQSDNAYATMTGPDGAFVFPLTGSNVSYQVAAQIGGVRQVKHVVAPTNGLIFRLPIPLIETAPAAITCAVDQGQDGPPCSFVVRNLPAASGDLRYTVSFLYEAEGPAGWIVITNGAPLTASLAPGTEQWYRFYPASASLPPGTYLATIRIEAVAANRTVVEIPVTLAIDDVLMVAYAGHRVRDLPGLSDEDGFLEPGETANVEVMLVNTNPYTAAYGLNATVSVAYPDDGTVTLNSDQLAWMLLPVGAVVVSDFPFEVSFDAAMTAPYAEFFCAGTDGDGDPFDFSFTITNRFYHSLTGVVQSVTAFPLTPTNVVSTVAGATVTAEAVDGTVLSSTTTGADGIYSLVGLLGDQPYWVRVTTTRGTPHVPPAGISLVPSADPGFDPILGSLTRNFQTVNYGSISNVPHLRFSRVEIDDSTGDGDGAVDVGETIRLTVYFENDALVSALNTTGLLMNAVFERPDCMTVIDGSVEIPANLPAGAVTPLAAAFEVQVNPTAVEGDYQRFWVSAATTNTPVLVWPFDFRIDVAPLHTVSGMIGFSDGGSPAKWAAVRVAAVTAEGDVAATTVPNTATGAYRLPGLRRGAYVIRITALPDGYQYPDPITVPLLSADLPGQDFTVIPWPVVTDPTAITLTLDEGSSTNRPFTVRNEGADPVDLALDIRHHRTLDDVLSAPAIGAERLGAIPTDWTGLDAAVYRTSELEIRFHDGVPMAAREAYLERHGLEAVFHYTLVPAVLARPKAGTLADLGGAAALSEPDVVYYMQPSVRLTRNALPADPYFGELWGLRNRRQTGGTLGADVGAEAAWSRSTGDVTVVVAVCDTGVMINHEDLEANIWTNPGESGVDAFGRDKATNGIDDDGNGYIDDVHGWNVALWNNDVTDVDGHGTHVAGTIGAVGDNGLGICGVNWRVQLMPVRFVDDNGFFASSAYLAKGVEYAMLNGARISNHSWGGPAESLVLYEMMRAGIAYNHLIIVAAGNSAENVDVIPAYPAYYGKLLDNVITVAAADHDDRLASFSSYGAQTVHLAAPGVNILSTIPSEQRPGSIGGEGALAPGDGSYAWLNGTSMATPHVAGAAALLFSMAPGARYDVIKAALIAGVRKDEALAGWVKTGGHLDVDRAARSLGRDWLLFDDAGATAGGLHLDWTLAAGGAATTTLALNDPPLLTAGEYQSSIVVSEAVGNKRIVPVNLTVLARALPVIGTVEVVNDADGDGYPEAGESASLRITLRNAGSASIDDLRATLGGTTRNYGYLSGLDVAEPDGVFPVVFPSLPATNALFTLMVYDGAVLVATLPVNVPLAQVLTIGGTVRAPGGAPVAGARVEVTGPHGASAVTAATGVFAINGLPVAGNYACRVIAPGFARWSQTVAAPTAGLNITLAAPRVSLSTNRIVRAVQQGMSAQVTLNVANSGVSGYTFTAVESPRRRIGLFADRDGLGGLVAPLRQMGFDVDRYTNNFTVTHYFNPFYNYNQILQYVRYTWDDSQLFPYDFVIADLSGPGGVGRPVYTQEIGAYTRYLERGGKVLFTGVNPLSLPDNRELADLLGLGTNACDRVEEALGQMTMAVGGGAPFAALAPGDRVAVAAGTYDIAAPSAVGMAEGVAGLTTSAKIVRAPVGDNGLAMLWTGNADSADWLQEGALQDLLRGFLWDALIAQAPVTWLDTAPGSGAVAAQSSAGLNLTLNGDRQLAPGAYAANLLLLGLADGEEALPVRVELTVAEPILRIHNRTGQVVDWGGRPLQGDGGNASCIVQLIWAGPNGVPDAPLADGSPGGDDMALAETRSGATFGYFGSGDDMPPNLGRFDLRFDHPFTPGTPNIVLFARAWDASTFASAMAYGDSTVRHTLKYAPDETVDFGSWTVSNVVSTFRDTNGDGIPDLWTINFRPDLDPRAPRTPLPSVAATTGTNNIATGAASEPARVVVSEKFLFVLERGKHRIGVYNRTTRAWVAYYGKSGGVSGSGNGEFNFPQGLGADPRAGQYRFAVADTQNNRIQVFTYNPNTGAVTFEQKFGTASPGSSVTSPAGTFWGPRAVTITAGGDFVVADTGNFRLQWFKSGGTHHKTFPLAVVGDAATRPEGICFDKVNNEDGVWVADSDPTKRRIAFYKLSGNGTPVSSSIIGGQYAGVFDNPTDVKVWTVGPRKRLIVSDWGNNRIRLMGMDGTPIFDFGNIAGSQAYERLNRPYGVTPVDGTPIVYVADQANNRVVWYTLTVDGDGDGMDDFWEDVNGLNSLIDDAFEDPDNDGLPNIGEFRARTNPQNPDTDGDGGGDLYEMVNNTDPLVPNPGGFSPARLLHLVADPVQAPTGEVVTVTATFDRAPETTVTAWFYNAAGSGIGTLEMGPAGSAVLACEFPATAHRLGWIDVELRSTDMDPPLHWAEDLFRIYAPLAVTSLTCLPAVVMQGQAVTVLVSFAEAVLTPPTVALSGGATLAPSAMTADSATTFRYVYTTAAPELGVVTGTVASAVSVATGETMLPVEFTFTIVLPVLDNWVPYPISGFRMTSWAPPTVGIFWSDAAKPAVAPTETYKIEHTSSLSPADWQAIIETQRSRPFGETSYSVFPLTDAFLDPKQNFFRLYRRE